MRRVIPVLLMIGSAFVVAAGCGERTKEAQNTQNSTNDALAAPDVESGQGEAAVGDTAPSGESDTLAANPSAATTDNGNTPGAAKPSDAQTVESPASDTTTSHKSASEADDDTPEKASEQESVESLGEGGYVAREETVRTSFAAPPEATALTAKNSLWIDRKRHRVYLDGYVAMQRGSLEMFACPAGTKEHESIVATLAKSREVHAALLAIKAMPGTPVQYVPEFVPATGQIIRVWICWRDKQQKFHVSDARKWVKKNGTKNEMKAEWVFAGSSIWKDPSDGRDYYQADGGDMICVSNFSTAMLDVTISSSAEADALQFEPYEERIPELGTPVRIILVPVPNPSDDRDAKPKYDPNEPPTEKVLPKGKATADSIDQVQAKQTE